MTEILLYGIIGDAFDNLDAVTVTTAIRAANGPLSIRINSPGGYVIEGLTIVAALRAYPHPVTVHIDGLAASMASVIAMIGAEIIMAETALMMIHKPWDASIGNADDLRRDAANLDRLEQQLIGIYAKRTGLSEGSLAAMLREETWFTAEQALAAGFITSIAEPLRIAAMASATGFGFRHLPDRLKETTVTDTIDTTQAVALERSRIATIMDLCTRHRISGNYAQGLIERGVPLEQARASILDQLATRDDTLNIGHAFQGQQTLDNPATYGEAVKGALYAKISGQAATGPAAEFQGLSVVDIARDFLGRSGNRDVTRMNPERVINMAMARGANPFTASSASGYHTTSDFPDLVGSASEKYLVDRYKMQESALKKLGRVRSRENFLTHYGVQMGGFGALDTVDEHGEYRNKTVLSRKEGYAIKKYGNVFSVTLEMLVNDGLGALADILTGMASAASETEAQVIAALINSNAPLSSDNKAWFHLDHKNLAPVGGAPSIATLDAARVAMRGQKDIDGVGVLDVVPKYLLVPVGLETSADVLVNSMYDPETANKLQRPNPFYGKLEPLADPRITNATAWHLFGDPERNPALEYAYLNGQTAPYTETREGWRVDGTEYKVRHIFGAGIVDYRMAYRNPGA